MSIKVYRVTRTRANPSYYKSATSTKLCSERSLKAQLGYIREVNEHYERYKEQYNLIEPSEAIIKIEVAEIGEFTDVTEDFI